MVPSCPPLVRWPLSADDLSFFDPLSNADRFFGFPHPAATIQGFRDSGVLFAFFHRILFTILFRLGKKWDLSLYLCISERLLPCVKDVKGQTQTLHGESPPSALWRIMALPLAPFTKPHVKWARCDTGWRCRW